MAATSQAPQTVDITNAPEISPKKHAMTSTWYKDDPSTWNYPQRLIVRLNLLQQGANTPEPPTHAKTDKVPYYPVYKQWIWMMPRAVASLAIHRLLMELTGWTFHPAFAFVFYVIAYKMFAVAGVQTFNRMGQKYGYFDGEHPRDGVPDQHIGKVFWSMIGTVSIRPIFACFLFYDRYEKPSLSLWFPVQMFIYSVTLDFWFYWYHRAMHEVPWLWKHHRLHHVTKHPNPLLSAFASDEQDWGDILVIPLLTWLVFPLDFPTWFMAQQMIIWTESFGHSGVRLYWQTPMTGYILRYFDMDFSKTMTSITGQDGGILPIMASKRGCGIRCLNLLGNASSAQKTTSTGSTRQRPARAYAFTPM